MGAIGRAFSRLEGPGKVTGGAKYSSDTSFEQAAYGYLATSAIARGKIVEIDETDARAVPGVIEIFTHRNIGKIEPGKTFDGGGYVGSTIAPLNSDKIFHDGQIVALVAAESFEAAREGAHRLHIRYQAEQPAASFDSPGAETVAAAKVSTSHEDPHVGDAEKAFARAPVKIQAHYTTATEHHNPMELFTTACAWEDGKLIVWESSQNMWGLKNGLARQLSMSADEVHAMSPLVGGAFGSRGSLTQRTAIVALAARQLSRPVKLMTTRDQGFTIATYRAETRHHIKLAAEHSGKLVSLTHEGEEVTSRPDDYMVAGTESSVRLYGCPNIASKVSIVHADRNTPGFMRSPPETPYIFALECAMDELACALEMDPVALRKANDTKREPIEGLPFSSRSLVECYDEGAKAFGWSRRERQIRAMRDGDWLVGMGTATALYPSNIASAAARVTLFPDNTALVQSATHEIGQGITTACALIAAERLGIDPGQIAVELGDSSLPPAPVSGGSNSTASVGNAVAKACTEIAIKRRQGINDKIEAYAEYSPKGAPDNDLKKLYSGKPAFAEREDAISYAFGAQFVEVRVHRLTGEIRVPRALGAFAAGTIVNPKTAESQLSGGMVWGISAALHEETEIDRKSARYYNDDLAEYLVPVNADIGEVKVLMLPEKENTLNPMGIKGIGELGNVGMSAAVVNAIHHATGVRVRRIPVRLEMLFPGLDPI